MKNTCYGFVLAAVLALCSAAAYGEAPRWETLSGKWQTGASGIVPEAGEQPCLLVDRSGLWDCEWFNLSVNFRLSDVCAGAGFGVALHIENKDDYHLLRITPAAGYTALQTLRWQYGNFRMWQEAHFPVLQPEREYNLSIVRAPVVDREDWRPWKIVVTDNADGTVLLKIGIENHMPAFGLGVTGLYAACDAVTFTDYSLDRPVPENLAGNLRLPMVFSDGMVLQRGRRVPVWGRAAAGASVRLTFAGKSYKTRADSAGDWKILLRPLAADTGLVMRVVSGKDTATLRDVAVGEVWFASGQSNMEMKVWESNVPMVSDPDIRLFVPFQWSSQEPVFTAGGAGVYGRRTVAEGGLGRRAALVGGLLRIRAGTERASGRAGRRHRRLFRRDGHRELDAAFRVGRRSGYQTDPRPLRAVDPSARKRPAGGGAFPVVLGCGGAAAYAGRSVQRHGRAADPVRNQRNSVVSGRIQRIQGPAVRTSFPDAGRFLARAVGRSRPEILFRPTGRLRRPGVGFGDRIRLAAFTGRADRKSVV